MEGRCKIDKTVNIARYCGFSGSLLCMSLGDIVFDFSITNTQRLAHAYFKHEVVYNKWKIQRFLETKIQAT